ncbi:MAG: glycosyltransferase [Actinomycetota bacterium]
MVELPSDPAVLVLLVVSDAAEWLPSTIAGIKAQEHDRIELIAVDNASTDGSQNMLLKSFGAENVITLERRVGYGRALAVALRVAADRELVADAILLVHDDAELQPRAITAMLDALARADAGIVGAKLVEWNDPSMLQDIGQTSDRYGRAVPRVERGELDQGQHDGIHDVLYATSAAMMIAREVIENVGLFDLRFVALRDDFDLCWRARLAGYRTLITTDAVARHASASTRAQRPGPVTARMRYFSERNMIASLIKNYGALRLAYTLPITVVISLLNTVLFFATGRRRAALQTLEALQWNIAHLPSTLRARFKAQHTRRARDADITRYMHHGATRLRAQFERAMEAVVGDIAEGDDEDGAKPPPTVLQRLRAHPTVTAILIALIVGIAGARTLFFKGQLAGADLAPFPTHAGSFFAGFFSGWRGAAHGGAAPATPGLVLLGILSFLSLGSTWLAQRVLLLGLPVLGSYLAYRLARALGLGAGARRLIAIAYLVSPIMLAAFGAGRPGDLVLLTAAPGLVLSLLRIAGYAELSWRHSAVATAGLAVTASLSPWAVALFAGSVVVLAGMNGAHVLRKGLAVVGAVLVVLFPWSIELFRPGSAFGAGGSGGASPMRSLIGLSPGALHPIAEPLRYGLAAAGLAGVLSASDERARVARALGVLSLAGLAFAYAVQRGVPWIAPRPALPLAATTIGVVVLAGIAFESAGPALSARQIGIRHIAAGIIGVLMIAEIGAGGLWVARGTHPGIETAGAILPAFIAADPSSAPYRIAWIGGSDGATAALTGSDGETMRDYLDRPAGAGARALVRTVAAITGGATSAGGRALGTLGVRYVVVRPGADPAVLAAFDRQVDLQFAQRFHGATVYENEAALPIASAVVGDATTWSVVFGATAPDDAGVVQPSDATVLRNRSRTTYAGTVKRKAGALLLAQDFSSSWRARAGTATLRPARAFGWATGFVGSAAGVVTITWSGNLWHRLMLLVELILVLLFVGEWSRRAARDRGER